MITKILLSYILITLITLVVGVVLRMSDVKTPKWFDIFLGVLILLFPFLLTASGIYWIWVE
jgi:sulfite exporter TauE/SafE